MAIILFDRDALVDYIPEYGGNRASESPVVVRIRPVMHARIQDYTRQIAIKNKGLQEPGKFLEASYEVQKKQFIENVESVSGLFIGEREVTTAAELYELADRDLIVEIIAAMESASKLSEGQRKN